MNILFSAYRSILVALTLLCAVALSPAHAQNNKFAWVSQVGGSIQDNGYAVATDSKGNVYATGYFQNNCFIGPLSNKDSLITHGSFDMFLTKMDRHGKLLWAHAIGGTASDEAHALAVDKNDNIIIAGSFRDTVNFGTGSTVAKRSSVAGSHDVFVAKYDSAGNYIWVKSFGSSRLDRAYSVKTDERNNVYITGQYYDTVTIPDLNINLIAVPGTATFTTDVFVCKLDAAGTFKWARSFGGPAGDVGAGLTVDKLGNVFTTGQFNDIADFNPGTAVSSLNAADGPIFISKLDSAGSFLWAKQLKTLYSPGHPITVDDNNDIYLTGEFSGAVDFNPGTGAADTFIVNSDLNVALTAPTSDGFVLKLNNNGLFTWVHKIGGSGLATGRGIAVDRSNNVYVVGTFSNIIQFDSAGQNINYTSNGSTDVFVEKRNQAGNFIWAARYGGRGAEFCRAIAVDASNNVFTVGHFVTTASSGPANFHTGNDTVGLTIHGGYDAYVHKMICPDTTYTNLTVTACNEHIFNGNSYTLSGLYEYRYTSAGGCDSIITLNLTVNYIDTAYITVNGFELGLTTTYATYQWFKDGVAIPGANGPTLTVTANAGYKVAVTTSTGCTDTSDVYRVNNVSVDDVYGIGKQIKIYPNPARDVIHINSPLAVSLLLCGLEGKMIRQSSATSLSLQDIPQGVYLLRIVDKDGRLLKVEKVVKQ